MLTKRLFIPIILVIMSAALVLLGPGDGNTLVGDTSVTGNEAAGGVGETDGPNSSTATITIIMKTPPLPD